MANSDVASIDVESASLAPSLSDDDEQDSLLTVDVDGGSEQGDLGEADKTTEQARKALEAAADEAHHAGQPHSPGSTSQPSSLRASGDWTEAVLEQRPLLDAGPAPPDYSQATAYRTFGQPSIHRRRGYGETGSQDAGDFNHELDSASLHSTRRKRKLSKYVRRHWRLVCLLNLAVYALLVIALLLLGQVNSGSRQSRDSNRYYPEHPEYDNAFGYPERQARFHKPTAGCSFDTYFLRGYDYNYRIARNFSFTEAIEPPENSEFSNFHVSGNIEIMPAPYAQTAPADLKMSIATTSPWQVTEPDFDWYPNGVIMRFPELQKTPHGDSEGRGPRKVLAQGSDKPCLSFYIGIYVKHRYETWEIYARHANVDIGYPNSFGTSKNWWFQVLNKTYISTQGNISASFLDSAEIDLHSTKGSIAGNYSFDDGINFATTSGNIDVLINQGANRDGGNKSTRLTSSTISGDTHISLHHETLPEDWVPRNEQYHLHSHHQSESGKISLNYNGWEGILTGTTSKGSIDISGTDFEYFRDATDVVPTASNGKHISIIKGQLNSTAKAESLSGDIEVALRDQGEYWPAVPV